MRYWRHIPPLKSLLAVEATAQCGSFSNAATELNVTQSAVSHLVGQAEDYLGARLFDRASRPIRLTREGQRYVNAVISGLNILKAEGQHLQERKAATTLIVSCNLGYGNFWLLPRLKHFHDRHPAITVNMVTTYQGLPELTDGIDVANPLRQGELAGLPLATALPRTHRTGGQRGLCRARAADPPAKGPTEAHAVTCPCNRSVLVRLEPVVRSFRRRMSVESAGPPLRQPRAY